MENEKCIPIVLLILVILTSPSVYAGDLATSANIPNIAPAVDVGLTPDDGPAPGVQIINPDTNTNKTVTISANVTDMNRYGDVVSVTANITGPGVVEDSPVSLNLSYVINVTTAVYIGTFNMSNHSEGRYEVEITAIDSGNLSGVGATNFIYLYALQPDTVVASISLSANPKTIKADGISNSTITAYLRNNSNLVANGTLVNFSTTLGTILPVQAYTVNGRAAAILTSSNAGTAVVRASSGGVSATTHLVIANITSTMANKTTNSTTITVGNSNVVANVTIQNGSIIINTDNADDANNTANNATAGTTISIDIGGGAKLMVTLEENAICENTTVFASISIILLNNPSNTYQTRAAGNSTVDLDVRFSGRFTPENLKFTLTQRGCLDDAAELADAGTSAIKNNLIAAFGISGVSCLDIDNNTACVIHSELSGADLSPEDIEEVPITITVSKDWFNYVAANNVSNVKIFKINDTTGIVEEIKNVRKVKIKETDTTITFDTEFCGFSLFALLSKPTPTTSTPTPFKTSLGGRNRTFPPSPSPVPTVIATPTETPTLAPTIAPTETPTQTPAPAIPAAQVPVMRWFMVLIAIFISAIIVLTGYLCMRKRS
jgi:hypothetical protein